MSISKKVENCRQFSTNLVIIIIFSKSVHNKENYICNIAFAEVRIEKKLYKVFKFVQPVDRQNQTKEAPNRA